MSAGQSRIKKWLSGLSGPALTAVMVGLLAGLFVTGVAYWYCARHLDWWTFSLFFAGSCLVNPTISAVRDATRRRKS